MLQHMHCKPVGAALEHSPAQGRLDYNHATEFASAQQACKPWHHRQPRCCTCQASFALGDAVNTPSGEAAVSHLREVDLFGKVLAPDRENARHDVGVAVYELGGGGHADVSPQGQGLLEGGGHNAVVHHHQGSCLHQQCQSCKQCKPDAAAYTMHDDCQHSAVLIRTLCSVCKM